MFPEGSEHRASFRINPNYPVLATINTQTEGIIRIDNDRIMVRLTGAQTANMPIGQVMFDLIRTDGPRPKHLGIRITIQVVQSTTDPNG